MHYTVSLAMLHLRMSEGFWQRHQRYLNHVAIVKITKQQTKRTHITSIEFFRTTLLSITKASHCTLYVVAVSTCLMTWIAFLISKVSPLSQRSFIVPLNMTSSSVDYVKIDGTYLLPTRIHLEP